jgi:DNA polymerase III subunit delta'
VSIILSDTAKKFADDFTQKPSHAVLLTGPRGVGLKTFALYLAEQAGTLHSVVEPIAKTPKGQAIINVERIRELYETTRTNLNGKHFIVIDDADRMNQTAQNALLKLLEEPNDTVHFILTSHAPDILLPTIRSRVWQFNVPPVSDITSRRLLKSQGVTDDVKLAQLLYVASGLPAELTRLSVGGADFDRLLSNVTQARKFIEGSSYERIIIANSLKDDREGALTFINTTVMLLKRTLKSAQDPRSTLELIDNLLAAHDIIRANGNVRLQLAAAVV